ncbi:MAG: DUF86 domain-containing protein, partial [Gammaproteobacteria bacterium]|nr:DUF86 domain-containing protein [Gammaproteobacteria bacterium]
MVDDVLLNKAASIERCLGRVVDEYAGHEDELETDYARQDSIVFNLQRACEAAIDAAMHQVRIKGLGIPQESRDAFRMLEAAGLLSAELSSHMQAMVGFRNVAVHDYQKLNLAIVRAILGERLDDFR